MALNKDDIIGTPTGATTIHVERGSVSRFAAGVTDNNPIYSDLRVAQEAGFEGTPVPPTWSFAAAYLGAYPEDQPEDPTNGKGNPLMGIIGALMKEGGIILHGEQEFIYHKPIESGQTLLQEGEIVDFYSKEAKGKTMTFIVMKTEFRDEDGELVTTETFNLIHRK